MAKRGRPMLNLSPEERLARRRAQVTNSQRKLRAGKRQGGSRSSGNHMKPNRISSDTSSPSAQQLDYTPTYCGNASTFRQFIDLHDPYKNTRQVRMLEHQVAEATHPFCDQTSDIAVPVPAMSPSSPASNLSPNLSQRTDAHSGLVMIDHPTENLPMLDGLVMIEQARGKDACDTSTELFPWANYLAIDDQTYNINDCDVSHGAFEFASGLDTSRDFYGTNIYESLDDELITYQPHPLLARSTHECPFVPEARKDDQFMNTWALEPFRDSHGCLPEMAAAFSDNSLCSHLDPRWLTNLSELAQASPQRTVDPSLIFV
ncbi:hypothetical protein EDB81DRAFT_752093 [Dactylonectria macrodidyma]|uniref:Uncharacterized protein n=1 Tax=Dactylonectria macrodidyma TaxID=307937 RepID=A0A9P9FUK0_9HYPO|nr:hypothetical protein EDB81DRAFT_752093 [Dactylonectria macrodidyma]